MSDLINKDQANSVQGRKITDHNHLIRDMISYAQDTQEQICILSLDQSKAFDNISHDFLQSVLEVHNIGPIYRRWIEIIYKNPKSTLAINHQYSKLIEVNK